MTSEKLVSAAVVALVTLKKDADIEMLDGGTLKSFKILSPGICTASEAGIDTVDGVPCFELVCKVSNTFIDLSNYILVIGETCFCAVSSHSVSLSLLLTSDGTENLQCNRRNISNSQGFAINRDDPVSSQLLLQSLPFGKNTRGMHSLWFLGV